MHDVEAEHVVPERERARDVSDLQVHMADVDSRIDRGGHAASLALRPKGQSQSRYGRASCRHRFPISLRTTGSPRTALANLNAPAANTFAPAAVS